MKKILWVLLFCMPLACSRNPILSIGREEMNGIDQVIAFYGGKCSYGVQLNVYENRTTRNFRLTLAESKILDEWKDHAALAASNIAWLFYKSLGDARRSYEEIEVELIFEKGTGRYGVTKYACSDLALVEKRMPLVRKAIGLIQRGSYDSLAVLFSKEPILEQEIDKEQVLKFLKDADKEFGVVRDTLIPCGFRITENSWGYQILDICGSLPRKEVDTECSITMGLKDNAEEIYLVDYDY